jgi:hypothetical protein
MPSDTCGYCSGPAHADRLEAIICEVQTRQVTHAPGWEQRRDSLLVAEIVRLRGLLNRNLVMVDGEVYDHRDIVRMREELAEYWWYAMQHECTDRGDGWLQPYMSEAEYASKQLVKIGQAEKHPEKDWYRAKRKSTDETD